MSICQHFQLLAKYNSRMNRQVYGQAKQLDFAVLQQDQGAFFGSIWGTLNHIMVGDLIWLGRFEACSDEFTALSPLRDIAVPRQLNQILFQDYNQLNQARTQIDDALSTWFTDTNDSQLNVPCCYTNTAGQSSARPLPALINHLFNHQTHHRGQVSTLLSQLGVDIGTTDLLLDIPELRHDK
ncbi:DinB family protein [Motilimonas pumila]|uniref:Damage-inducible protein DinB n=1 Tax=Motilimonas pumila TaxID=2303987 RepID=A0A418YAA1_9GAMM|nr:DinB family protein [Motilimonas pumila]RJG39450.1 damage-inducible protein DinB [Motilimonas pumila]